MKSEAMMLKGMTTGQSSRNVPAVTVPVPTPFRLAFDNPISIRIKQIAAPVDVQIAVRNTVCLGGWWFKKVLEGERYHSLVVIQNHLRRNPTVYSEFVNVSHTNAQYFPMTCQD